LSWGVGASAPAPARQFHQAGWELRPPTCPVHDDVGVRFGGSEHHRIGTSSSHTRPPPYGAGHPANGAGQTARLGASRARFHRGTASGALRGTGRTASTGQGTRRASAHQAPHLTRGREPGALRRTRHPTTDRDREPGALRHTRHPIPAAAGNRTSSEARPPTTDPGQGTGPLRRHGPPPRNGHVHGLVGKEPRPRGTATELFGAPPARPRRSQADGAPRRTASRSPRSRVDGAPRGTASPAPRDREPGALRRTRPPTPPGTGNRTSSEARPPTSDRDREPDLLGGSAPHPTGSGPRRGMSTPPTGQGCGALRRTAGRASPGPSKRRPSGHRGPGPVGNGAPRSSEHGAPSHRSREPGPPRRAGDPASARAGTPAPPRLPELFGAPPVGNGLVPGPPRRPRTPHSTGRWHPAPRGRTTGDSRVGTTRCTSPASAAWRSAKEPGLGRARNRARR
jgi:hypothetical protein